MTAHDLLQSLIDRGQTQKQIEDATGIKQPTISRILARAQKDLPFSAGKRLEQFADTIRAAQSTTPPQTFDGGSGDPRHGELRAAEKRSGNDRRGEDKEVA